jgi:hypothetical protein
MCRAVQPPPPREASGLGGGPGDVGELVHGALEVGGVFQRNAYGSVVALTPGGGQIVSLWLLHSRAGCHQLHTPYAILGGCRHSRGCLRRIGYVVWCLPAKMTRWKVVSNPLEPYLRRSISRSPGCSLWPPLRQLSPPTHEAPARAAPPSKEMGVRGAS